jgi:serine/threonine protein kinase
MLLLQVIQEYQVHQQLTSEHVVPFWAALDDGPTLHIVMQYCEQSDLRSMLGSGPLSEACVRDQVVIPLLHALQELHEKVRCNGLGSAHTSLKRIAATGSWRGDNTDSRL